MGKGEEIWGGKEREGGKEGRQVRKSPSGRKKTLKTSEVLVMAYNCG